MSTQDTLMSRFGSLGHGTKLAVAFSAVLLIASMAWAVFLFARETYGTLFTQLSDRDAAAIVTELKRQKVQYRLSDDGSTISVPEKQVHDTRLSLMSANVLLSGGVGFEIFDTQGLGTTEQSQRISYQRALQGELARTIAALDNVKLARVHLVLPESTLFKRDMQEATAAVTLTLAPGAALGRPQILGVQRLVAASVAGLDPSRVVIADQRGVTLSFVEPAGAAAGNMEARLEMQRQVEAHLAQKIARMLDGSVGPGQAIVSVDVALQFNATKTTTQNLLPLAGGAGVPTNAVSRRRQVTSGDHPDESMLADVVDSTATGRRSASTTEIEYEYGKRVEEVIAAPGAIRRVTIGVIVPASIDSQQQEGIRQLVRVAAGIDDARGDVVTVQPLGQQLLEKAAPAAASEARMDGGMAPEAVSSSGRRQWLRSGALSISTLVSIGVVASLLIVLALRSGRRRTLTQQQREQLLAEIRSTLGEGAATTQVKARQ